MTTCPEFTNITASTLFLTSENIDDLIPDNFERTVGTSVTVSCRSRYTLVGDNVFTCLATGQWSFSTTPICSPDGVTGSPVDTGKDNDEDILIGVVCGVAGLIVIILGILMVAVWCRNKRNKNGNYSDYEMDSRQGNRRYMDRVDAYGRGSMPPPAYRSEPSYGPNRSSRHYDERSQSGPMYLPRDKPAYSDYYDKLKQSRKKPTLNDEDYERRGNRPYVREWVRRSSSREYEAPSVHGRSGYRDSQLWRESRY